MPSDLNMGAKDIGVQTSVWCDGKDLTWLLNSCNVLPDDAAEQSTTFRPIEFSHSFIAGIGDATLNTAGYLPTIMSEDNAEALLRANVGERRHGQDVLVGVSGFEVGHMAFIAKSLRTSLNAQIEYAGIMELNADFQVSSGSDGLPGLCPGRCLISPHGNSLAPGVSEGQGKADYSVITSSVDGEPVLDGVTSDKGIEVMVQALEPGGATPSVTVKILHAEDNGGEPGSWEELVALDPITESGAYRARIAPGTEIYPFLKASVEAVQGEWVLAVAAARH